MEEYDMNNPLELGEDEKEEKEEIKKDESNNKIKLTKEEEDIVEGYDNLLNKILKAFNILYLCKSKTEFINLMREKGINQQNYEENKISVVTTKRTKKRKKSKRGSVKSAFKKSLEESEIKKNVEEDEEDDTSNNDQDKNILNKFLQEQKKVVDDFIKVRKIELRKPPADK